ncbi:T-cell receptor beta chain V region PHDS203, partial [Tupaia chinensis]
IRILCYVVISFLGAGFNSAVVLQFPRHRVSKTEKELTLQCSQNMSHLAMYWYRQDPGSGLQLVYYSPGTGITEKGEVSEGYRVSREQIDYFPLTLESASSTQTSVYICASSSSTALRCHILLAQKRKGHVRK